MTTDHPNRADTPRARRDWLLDRSPRVRDGRARARAPKPKILTWQEALLIAAAEARTTGADMRIRRLNGRRSW